MPLVINTQNVLFSSIATKSREAATVCDSSTALRGTAEVQKLIGLLWCELLVSNSLTLHFHQSTRTKRIQWNALKMNWLTRHNWIFKKEVLVRNHWEITYKPDYEQEICQMRELFIYWLLETICFSIVHFWKVKRHPGKTQKNWSSRSGLQTGRSGQHQHPFPSKRKGVNKCREITN